MVKRTKVVCTLGPATDAADVLERLIEAGMNVARFNFSHGDHAAHLRRLQRLRDVAGRAGAHVAALGDLQGPKIRVGRFASGPVQLVPGRAFTITTRPLPGDERIVSTTHAALPRDARPGDSVLLADGLLELKVTSVGETDVECEVVVGGLLSDNKGINLPHAHVSAPSLTDKDRQDLAFAIAQGFDMLALSFVRRAADLAEARRLVREAGADVPLVAKIEKPQALASFDEILAESDAVMVARGDLGVEMPPESVPATQKQIIHACRQAGVPVITATQMLESMIENPRPTRAEASDVANAIFDGTDAVMLSAETSTGRYPEAAVQMMTRIARVAEIQEPGDRRAAAAAALASAPSPAPGLGGVGLPPAAAAGKEEAVSLSSCHAADALGAEHLVVYTSSGSTARLVAKHRPRTSILALTPRPECARRLAIVWGVRAFVVDEVSTVEDLTRMIDRVLLERMLARAGDTVVVTAGTPLGRPGTTNMMKIHEVGAA
jgi:pyruvate kinase